MNNKFFLAILCALCLLVAFTGCKKEETKTDAPAAEAKAEEAKAEEAKAEAPKAEEAKAEAPKAEEVKAAPAAAPADDVNKAIKDAGDFFTGLAKTATDAGEDCDKMGKDLTAYLQANESKLTSSMRTLAGLEKDGNLDPATKAEMDKLESVMSDSSDFSKQMAKCGENPSVQGFSLLFLASLAKLEQEAEAK